MEFGRVPVAELESIHFSLPAEPEENLQVLGGRSVDAPKLYLGCAKWGRPGQGYCE